MVNFLEVTENPQINYEKFFDLRELYLENSETEIDKKFNAKNELFCYSC